MKRILNLIVFIFIVTVATATNQRKDILVMNGDTLYLYNSPLEQFDNISERISGLYQKKYKDEIMSTNCWRGYTASWIIKDSTLYLTELKKHYSEVNINKIVERILGRKFQNGLLKADWVNGNFWSGKNLAPVLQLYITVFCNETKLELKNGHVESIVTKDFKPCNYSDMNKLNEFVFSHINWIAFPDLTNKSIEITAYIESDKEGRITNVEIERTSDSQFNDEIIHVLKQLPCLSVYYNEGTFYDVGQSIEFTIDENIKKKYAP